MVLEAMLTDLWHPVSKDVSRASLTFNTESQRDQFLLTSREVLQSHLPIDSSSSHRLFLNFARIILLVWFCFLVFSFLFFPLYLLFGCFRGGIGT